MTLKDRFIDAFKSGKRFDIQNAETITDEFAIEFAYWCEWYADKPLYTYKELLEIFKKERNL